MRGMGILARLALLSLVAAAPAAPPPSDPATAIVGLDHAVATPTGLRYLDRKSGHGAASKPGDSVTVQYTGWLFEDGRKGLKFDSTYDRNEPFTFVLGEHRVIPGWDEGVAGMKPGGQRVLIIPPELGYGDRGAGGVIPPGATLAFEITLQSVTAAPPAPAPPK